MRRRHDRPAAWRQCIGGWEGTEVESLHRGMRHNVPFRQRDQLEVRRGCRHRGRVPRKDALDRKVCQRDGVQVRARKYDGTQRIAHELCDRRPKANVIVKEHIRLIQQNQRLMRHISYTSARVAQHHVIARKLSHRTGQVLATAATHARVQLKHLKA